jgi:hypothetical protein
MLNQEEVTSMDTFALMDVTPMCDFFTHQGLISAMAASFKAMELISNGIQTYTGSANQER